MLVAVVAAGWGCAAAPPPRGPAELPIVEWHASERAYGLEPLREKVVVWADGRIEAEGVPRQRRIVLTSAQMDRLFVLLSQADFLRADPADDRLFGRFGEARDPDRVREVLMVYSPRPGLRREIRRSWADGALEEGAFTPECYVRLEMLDGFFRELLWKDCGTRSR